MSKENVALFVRMLADKRDLSKQASADRTTQGWVKLGRNAGLEYDDSDVAAFVTELTGTRVTTATAVTELLKVVEDKSAAGAGPAGAITFTAELGRKLVAAGYTPPGGAVAKFVQFPPDPLPQRGNPGGIKGPQGGR